MTARKPAIGQTAAKKPASRTRTRRTPDPKPAPRTITHPLTGEWDDTSTPIGFEIASKLTGGAS